MPYILADHLYIQSASLFFRSRIFESGLRDKRINEYLVIFRMTGENLTTKGVGISELKKFQSSNNLCSYFRLPLNGFRYLEKLFAGGYFENPPLKYAIYDSDLSNRTEFVEKNPSWRFRWN